MEELPYLDTEEMAKWISDRCDIDLDTILTVLDLESEYMEENGFIDENYEFDNYDE